MKIQPILAALAVAILAFAQPALAQFTQNEKGEVTHYNGIPLPPIPTVEEARAQAQKEIAAAKKAREAEQVAAATSGNLQSEIGNQQLFFTGKPYLEETGQYLFLFRHYDPELARWTTADPSGFPDGANNLAYMAVPTTEFDWQGLASINVNHTFTAYDNIQTVITATIQGTWSNPPSVSDVRWGTGTTVGGSKTFSSGSKSSTVSWHATSPNLLLSNITDDGDPNLKTYSMDLKWLASLEITWASTFDIDFSIYGMNVKLLGTGNSTTKNYNFSATGSASLTVAKALE